MKTERRRLAALVAAALTVAAAGSAGATDYVLNLTGDFSTFATSTAGSNPTFYIGSLELTGFDAFDLAQGDTLSTHVTITNGPFTVGSYDTEFVGLNYFNFAETIPANSQIDGTFSFDGAAPIVAGCGNCVHQIIGVSNTPLSFSSLQADSTITVLDAAYHVDRITLSYQLNNDATVPEPAAWALMLIGFGGLGAQMRRARRLRALA